MCLPVHVKGSTQVSIANVMQQQGHLQAALGKYGEAVLEATLGLNHLEPAKTRVNIKAAHAQMQILHSRLKLHYFSILVQVR